MNKKVFKIFKNGEVLDGRNFTSLRAARAPVGQRYRSKLHFYPDMTRKEFSKDYEIGEYYPKP